MERFALEGYVVDELIGFGGTGQVWRAREVTTGETVALKRLTSRGVRATERLRREAGILATVAGPHVIGLRRMVVDEDEAVMVMDYAAGGSLAAVLSVRGKLPAPEVVTVASPIAAALAAAHARDMIHGDLTPANILFTLDGRPLLADFGVARAIGTTAGRVEATADYLDPVVAAGGQPTPATDVFALGAVAFTALSGHSPWGSGTRDELVQRAASGLRPAVADVVPDLSPDLAAAIEAMLAANPDDRPDARSAGNALLRASAVSPVRLVSQPPPTVVLPPPPTQVVRPAARARSESARSESARSASADLPRPRSSVFEEVDEDDEPTWTPWRRRIVVAGAAGLALVGAIGVGVSLAGSGHSPHQLAGPPATTAAPVALESHPTTRWIAIVRHLDAVRADAFSEADVASLSEVYAPGAAAYDKDVATLRSLENRGLHAEGFTATVESVSPIDGTATTERLRVVDRLSGYELVDDAGAIVGHGPPRSATAFTMTLTDVGDAWRVAAITDD